MENIEFRRLRFEAGFINDEACAKLLGVTVKTIRNWDKQKRAPKTVIMILGLFCGRFEFLGKQWNGFVLGSDGLLYSSDGCFIYPGEIRAMPYLYQSAGLQRSEVCGQLDNRGILYSIAPNPKKKTILSYSNSSFGVHIFPVMSSITIIDGL